ncbi:MAG TPA: transketolase C-terminal domain-containing protein, partial [Emticicia sp.]
LLKEVFSKFDKIITVEDGCILGGFGSAVVEFATDSLYKGQIKRLGIPDEVVEHGEQKELWAECGCDSTAIISEVKKMVVARVTKGMVG